MKKLAELLGMETKEAEEKRKQAAEKLRRLVNVNFDNGSVNIEVGYIKRSE